MGIGDLPGAIRWLRQSLAGLLVINEMAGWRFHTLLSPVQALGMSGDGVGASRGPDNLETCWTPVVRFLDAQVLIATAWVAAAQGVVSEVQRLDQPSPPPRNSADSPTGAAHRRACRARRRTLDDADMSEFELPSNLARRLALHELPGSALRGWVTELPSMVERPALRWSLRLGRPFQPGGVTSWVAPARTDDGATVVLKVSWRHLEALHEVDGLRVWAGNGAVQLVDSAVLVSTTALLLEACDPGTTLASAAAEEQDEVVAGQLRRLWIEPSPGHPFRPLADMCRWWADEFERKSAAAQPEARIDPGLARAGSDLFRGLPASSERSVLLCTDLHAGNVLAARREPWLVIDPKPYLGDPTYDPLQHMVNSPDRLVADPAGFADRMAGLLDLDASRLRHWLFARCVLGSLDRPFLGGVAAALAP